MFPFAIRENVTMEAVFTARSVERLYKKYQLPATVNYSSILFREGATKEQTATV
jgi:hypothetical protein